MPLRILTDLLTKLPQHKKTTQKISLKKKKKKNHDTFPLNKWILFSIYQKWSFLKNFLNQTLIKHNYVFLRGEIILSYLTLLCLI